MKTKDYKYVVLYQIGIGDVQIQYASSEEEALNLAESIRSDSCPRIAFVNVYELLKKC